MACAALSVYTRTLLFTAAAVLGCREMCAALEKLQLKCAASVLYGLIAGVSALCLLGAGSVWYCAWLFLFVAVVISLGVASKRYNARDVLATLAVALYPVLPFALITRLGVLDMWVPVFVLACASTWVCDSFALFGGMLFGKHKLAPAVSPNKTVEGTLCGAASSLLAGAAVFFAFRAFYDGIPLWLCLAAALAASSAGQLGDLAASLFKRLAGIKDYSNLIPGHGGVLDRTDSLLFSIPTAYFCFFLAGIV